MTALTTDQMLREARSALHHSQGAVNANYSVAMSNQAIAYTLIAIALQLQELNRQIRTGVQGAPPIENLYRQ